MRCGLHSCVEDLIGLQKAVLERVHSTGEGRQAAYAVAVYLVRLLYTACFHTPALLAEQPTCTIRWLT